MTFLLHEYLERMNSLIRKEVALFFSVCIPTVRPTTLSAAVESVLRQSFEDFELIVVGQGDAGEAMRSVVESVAGSDSRVRYVHSDRRGLCVARNLAVRETTSPWVVFMDDDCEAADDWLLRMSGLCSDGVEFVCGSLHSPPLKPKRLSVCPSVHPTELTFVLKSGIEPPIGFGLLGANMALHRSLLNRVGSFDEHMGAGSDFQGGEEHDYIIRAAELGITVRCSSRPAMHHTFGIRSGLRAVFAYKRERIRGVVLWPPSKH